MISGLNSQTGSVDTIFLFIMGVSVIILLIVTILMLFFLFKYSRKRNPHPKNIESNALLEIIWVVIPTVLVLAMFYYGWSGFSIMRTPPEDSMVVKVGSRMWSWSFTYDNGKKSEVLRVPLDRPVRLVITSDDVIHALFIPQFRVKEDAVPGLETYLWFLPEETGSFDLFCSEYCGIKHHNMITKVIVMEQGDFSKWYLTEETISDKAVPAYSLMDENGCFECHSTDGSTGIGPGFKDLFGSKETVITEGKEREIIINNEYILRSILNPEDDVVKGYPSVMPSYEGELNKKELESILEFIKDLK
jgi:cytochrome c oxidase subunit 2